MKKLLALFLLFAGASLAQKGGLNYPVLTQQQAILEGYHLVSTTDSLLKYAKINDSKIFIAQSFTLAQRCSVSGNNVIIASDKKSIITSALWFSAPFRFFESFTILGSNVTMQGLKLQGVDCDIRTLDTVLYQTAIRCQATNFHLINCELRCWGWCAVYFHRMQGALVEQCYIAQTKNNSYGYGLWFEGTPNQIAECRNNIFEDCRESIDAGGQITYWSATGNVTDRSIVSHKQPNQLAGRGTIVSGNYFLRSGTNFPLPLDSGYLIITDNHFAADSVNSISITGVNPLAKVTVYGNYFNGQGMNLPVCSLRVDAIRSHIADFTFLSAYRLIEVYYGDGTPPAFTLSGVNHHSYIIDGTYLVGIRTFDNFGIPSEIVYKKIVIGSGLNFAFKTTARFQPAANYYQVQLLIDDTIKDVFDASKNWNWKRITRNYLLTGVHKVAIRLVCLRDCINPIQLFVDDFDYNGTVSNASFETPYYEPPISYWRYRAVGGVGNAVSVGAGADFKERCSGAYSWRFELRPDKLPVTKGTFCEIYNSINFSQ